MAETSDHAIEAARAHAARHVQPAVARWERDGVFPREAWAAAGQSRLTGLFVPEADGGMALPWPAAAAVFEELGRADPGWAFALSGHNAVATTVALHGSPALRARVLSRLARGELIGSFAATEPQGGSDPSGNETLATPLPGGGWRISGRKAWATHAAHAGAYLVLARTAEGRGHRDQLIALVDAGAPGVRPGRRHETPAARWLPVGELELDGAEVGPDDVLAPPGKGLQAALFAIDVARVAVAGMGVGLAAEALDVVLAWAARRSLYGRPLLELDALRHRLADVETDIVAGRALAARAAALLGTPEGPVACAHAKRFCADAAVRAAATCSEAMGAWGWDEAISPLPRLQALARMLLSIDGTADVQRTVIGRELLQRAREGAGAGTDTGPGASAGA